MRQFHYGSADIAVFGEFRLRFFHDRIGQGARTGRKIKNTRHDFFSLYMSFYVLSCFFGNLGNVNSLAGDFFAFIIHGRVAYFGGAGLSFVHSTSSFVPDLSEGCSRTMATPHC